MKPILIGASVFLWLLVGVQVHVYMHAGNIFTAASGLFSLGWAVYITYLTVSKWRYL